MQQDASIIRQLPLLERPWRAVVADGFEAGRLAPVVVVALDCPANHWPHHALSWLEDGFPISADIDDVPCGGVTRERFDEGPDVGRAIV